MKYSSHNQDKDIFGSKFANSSKIVRAKDVNGFPSLSLTLDDHDLPSTFLVPHKDWAQVLDESGPALHPPLQKVWLESVVVVKAATASLSLPPALSTTSPEPTPLPPSSQCSTSCRAATMVLESRCAWKTTSSWTFCRSWFMGLWSACCIGYDCELF